MNSVAFVGLVFTLVDMTFQRENQSCRETCRHLNLLCFFWKFAMDLPVYGRRAYLGQYKDRLRHSASNEYEWAIQSLVLRYYSSCILTWAQARKHNYPIAFCTFPVSSGASNSSECDWSMMGPAWILPRLSFTSTSFGRNPKRDVPGQFKRIRTGTRFVLLIRTFCNNVTCSCIATTSWYFRSERKIGASEDSLAARFRVHFSSWNRSSPIPMTNGTT